MRPLFDPTDLRLVFNQFWTQNNLTETEIDALKDAVSDNFFKDRGWTTDEQGRVKEKGYPVYKTGYVTAIKKSIYNRKVIDALLV